MALTLTLAEPKKGAFVVTLEGRLDHSTAPDCEARLKPLLTDQTRSLVLDLHKLDYISSMGLRILIHAGKVLKKAQGVFTLKNPQPQVKEVLKLSEIYPHLDVFESEKGADIFLDAIQRKEKKKTFDVDA